MCVCFLFPLLECLAFPFSRLGPPVGGFVGGRRGASGAEGRREMRARAEFRPRQPGSSPRGAGPDGSLLPLLPFLGSRAFVWSGQEGVKGAPPPSPARALPPQLFLPEVSLGNPPRYFQHFLNQGPLNRAAQTNWRQKRRSCHDWDRPNISALFALQLRTGFWLRCHRGKTAAARFLSAPGGGGRTRGAGAGRGECGEGAGAAGLSSGAFPSRWSGWGARGVNAPDSAHVESSVSTCPASFLPSSAPLFCIPSSFPLALLGGYRISLSLSLAYLVPFSLATYSGLILCAKSL